MTLEDATLAGASMTDLKNGLELEADADEPEYPPPGDDDY